jgi:hypothetical protein
MELLVLLPPLDDDEEAVATNGRTNRNAAAKRMDR